MLKKEGAHQIDPQKDVLVGQRECGIISAECEATVIATENVAMCTVFFGLSRCRSVGFMCHYDFYFAIRYLPLLYKHLANYIEAGSVFDCVISGGWKVSWAASGFMQSSLADQMQKLNDPARISLNLTNTNTLDYGCNRRAYWLNIENGTWGDTETKRVAMHIKHLFNPKPRFVYLP